MRPAAEILIIEGRALRPIVEAAPLEAFDIETICTGWSVRDVLGHCGAALTRTATGNRHGFTPEDNQLDVDERKTWPLAKVLEELFTGYKDAAAVIDAAGGSLDGVGLGEWVHGGDVREALGVGVPYASEGADLARGLLLERSALLDRPRIDVAIDGEMHAFGAGEPPVGRALADLATFVRLCGGRRPDPGGFRLEGCSPADFVLFS